jgi:cytochrome c oxidase subunit 2
MKKWTGLLLAAILVFVSAGSVLADEATVIKVTAQKYHFTPETITVHQGDKVVLEVTAIDTDHGFGIAAYNINELLPKGKTVTIEFTADKKGKFTIKCTHFCGLGHFWMSGTLEVV